MPLDPLLIELLACPEDKDHFFFDDENLLQPRLKRVRTRSSTRSGADRRVDAGSKSLEHGGRRRESKLARCRRRSAPDAQAQG